MGNENPEELSDLPEITVIGRFTKGHYSGAGIPSHSSRTNFVYNQQASVSENWSDEDIVLLVLSLLKSHLSLKAFVGGKTHHEDERNTIRTKREIGLFYNTISRSDRPSKRIISFAPTGPMYITF